MSKFVGRVAVVTGAGSGIGRALAVGLARRGANLALSDVNDVGLKETELLIQDTGRRVLTAQVDVSDRDAVDEFATAVANRFSRVNQVYNNAGIAFARPVLETTYADYEKVLAVNLWGVIHGTKEFLPHLIASGDGHVVNVSSLNGIMAQAEMSHYVTSKFAVRGFTESLRLEMLAAKHPVRVTSVHPGGIRTNIASSAIDVGRELGYAEVTEADERRRRTYNDKLLRMSPDKAADIILKAVRRNRGRVLVGSDAKAMDLVVRAMPSGYIRTSGPITERIFAK